MAKQPDPFPSLLARIKRIEEMLRRFLNSSPFFGTGFHPTADNGIESDNFDGDLNAGDAGTRGWAMDSDQAAFGELILRPGSIGNDSLTNPVLPASVWETASNFTVDTSWTTVITKNLTVPAGFTSAVISAKGRVTAFMNQDSVDDIDYLYAVLTVAGNSSDYYPLAVSDNGGSGTNQVFRDVVLTGLTGGGTVTLALQASTGFETWTSPSSPGNIAKLGASVQWYR